MKSSMFLGALCALGAVAQEVKNPSEVKPSYVTTWTTTTVTDWTTQTITKTITVRPTGTTTVPPANIKVQETSTSSAKPTTTAEPTTAEPTTTQEPVQTQEPEQPEQTSWSTSWESTWTPTQSATSTEEAPTQSQAPAPANGYQSKVLDSHNVHRANHSSDALTWSKDLETSAQALASSCVYQHDTYGQPQ